MINLITKYQFLPAYKPQDIITQQMKNTIQISISYLFMLSLDYV